MQRALDRVALTVVLAAVVCGVSPRASAQVIYDYVGAPFTAADPPFSLGDRLTGYIVLPDVLPASMPMTEIGALLLDFYFDDGVYSRDPVDNTVCLLQVATDPAGEIVDWFFFVRQTVDPTGSAQLVADSHGPSWPTGGDDVVGFGVPGPTLCSNIPLNTAATSSVPGSWALMLFGDGFESGDVGGWSGSLP